nr:T-cell receptor V beta CDR3 region {clone V5Mz28} [mice, NOD, spleen, Peptide Partial, 16 aa] [Mus sp.]
CASSLLTGGVYAEQFF